MAPSAPRGSQRGTKKQRKGKVKLKEKPGFLWLLPVCKTRWRRVKSLVRRKVRGGKIVIVMTMTLSRSLKIEVGLNEGESPQTQTPKGFWKEKREKSDPTYDAFGRQTKLSGTLDADFGYAHYYVNRSTGLYLTKYRAYDPEKGRWLSRDPLGEIGRPGFVNATALASGSGRVFPKNYSGLNLYSYVNNNPLEFIDPLGLEAITPPDVWHPPMWPPPDPCEAQYGRRMLGCYKEYIKNMKTCVKTGPGALECATEQMDKYKSCSDMAKTQKDICASEGPDVQD